jgi:hypothetical protein
LLTEFSSFTYTLLEFYCHRCARDLKWGQHLRQRLEVRFNREV